MSNHIFWIASFPKSGNTLTRAIISSLFFTNDGNFSLEKLSNINQFEKTAIIVKNKKIFGEDFNNLNDTSTFYKYMHKLQTKEVLGFNQDFIFLKTHSGLYEIGGNPFTKKETTRGIIYIIRDPRDVCISWSKHLDLSFDKIIDFMTNEFASSPWVEPSSSQVYFENDKRPKSFLSSWDKHVVSWTSQSWGVPVKVIKYEDLVYNKNIVLKDIVNFFIENYNFKFIGIEDKIRNILISTDFNKLKKEEKEKKFFGNKKHDFFSVGKKDQWKEVLSTKQIEKIENKFKYIMRKFGYKLAVEI
ncbi:sulfotransferase domain-containing protein [Pelagibacteraceae bacterium]|nr:sulfotransferase domain-containing protein [Pelagibacteraceae bacterium]